MISKCDLNMIHLFYSFFYFIHYILIGFSDKCEFITFSGHKTGVNCLAFSPDELVLASGGKVTFIFCFYSVFAFAIDTDFSPMIYFFLWNLVLGFSNCIVGYC